MAKWISRSGLANAAVDVVAPINVNTVGVGTGDFINSMGYTRISKLVITTARATLVASVGVTLTLRISGDGVVNQPHEITFAAHEEDTTTTAGSKARAPYVEDNPGIELTAGPIVLEVIAKGTDAGNEEITVSMKME